MAYRDRYPTLSPDRYPFLDNHGWNDLHAARVGDLVQVKRDMASAPHSCRVYTGILTHRNDHTLSLYPIDAGSIRWYPRDAGPILVVGNHHLSYFRIVSRIANNLENLEDRDGP